jgi:hypothetical protein
MDPNVFVTGEAPPDGGIDPLDTFCHHLATSSMTNAFGRTPFSWQSDAIVAILKMVVARNEPHPAPILLVRPTGGGKSSVRDTLGHCLCGVVLTISPLLSLSADQVNKLRSTARQQAGSFIVRNLDEVTDMADMRLLSRQLTSFSVDSTAAVYLFSSPQAITRNEIWKKMIHVLLKKRLLRLVCVDEIHLFARFGMYFRSEFLELKDVLFSKLINTHVPKFTTIIPVLFMTATCSLEIAKQVQLLTGLSFPKENILWAPSTEMARRNVSIALHHTNQNLCLFQKIALPIFTDESTPHFKKVILYTNFRSRATRFRMKIREWLVEKDILADIVPVDGSLFKEQKFYNTSLFLTKIRRHGQAPGTFLPNILIATSGAANAGLDSDDIFLVYRDGFPPSVEDMMQEMGRAGRRPSATHTTDRYCISYDLQSYVTLLQRIYGFVVDPDFDSKDVLLPLEEYRQQQDDNLKEVLRLLVPGKNCPCIHQVMERHAGNPYVEDPVDPPLIDNGVTDPVQTPCVVACAICNKLHLSFVPTHRPLSRSGTIRILSKILVNNNRKNTVVLSKLPNEICAVKDYKVSMFGEDGSKMDIKKKEIRAVILHLLSADILYGYPEFEGVEILVGLPVGKESNIPNIYDPMVWERHFALLP